VARIFLCHASEDKAQVREVYHRLRAIDGFEPWLDEEDLLPGQDWTREIPRALQKSDFILVFFSRLSVAKHGYVQREMKLALDALQELPEGTIHTIPVRLDDCEVPASFQPYHYANLFAPNGFDYIVRAIRAEIAQRSERDWPEVRRYTTGDTREIPGLSRRHKRLFVLVGGVLLCVLVTALYLVLWRRAPGPQPQPEPRSARTTEGTQPASSLTNSLGMQFALIPAGEFQMGSIGGLDDEYPVHRVRISAPFYLGKYEVTQAQWEAVMGTNPSRFQGNPNRPVEMVSWENVQEFITRLNKQEGWEVCRLPTEAQWEYAARAGTTTERYENDVDAIAWHLGNSGKETHAVGQKRPNAWGVYDMLGNVAEWCHDGPRTYTRDTAVDPIGPTGAGVPRAIRGGSWAPPCWACGLPTATGSSPTSATTPLASAVRVQAPASDERSETCRIRRCGVESVRHGWRSEKA
jgi:formylglycine-generating enzyme required for sulfatase activity